VSEYLHQYSNYAEKLSELSGVVKESLSSIQQHDLFLRLQDTSREQDKRIAELEEQVKKLTHSNDSHVLCIADMTKKHEAQIESRVKTHLQWVDQHKKAMADLTSQHKKTVADHKKAMINLTSQHKKTVAALHTNLRKVREEEKSLQTRLHKLEDEFKSQDAKKRYEDWNDLNVFLYLLDWTEPGAYVWHCIVDGKSIPYENSSFIDTQFLRKRHILGIQRKNFNYTLDFKALTQVNQETKVSRHIERVNHTSPYLTNVKGTQFSRHTLYKGSYEYHYIADQVSKTYHKPIVRIEKYLSRVGVPPSGHS
jgi:hypothetical protein